MVSHEAYFPDIDFSVNGNGLTVRSKRLNTPRFVPWDTPGRCTHCKSQAVDVDYLLQPHGITLFSNRLRDAKWVPFDVVRQWRAGQAVRIRSRSKSMMIKLIEEYGVGEQQYDKKGERILLNDPDAGLPPPSKQAKVVEEDMDALIAQAMDDTKIAEEKKEEEVKKADNVVDHSDATILPPQ